MSPEEYKLGLDRNGELSRIGDGLAKILKRLDDAAGDRAAMCRLKELEVARLGEIEVRLRAISDQLGVIADRMV